MVDLQKPCVKCGAVDRNIRGQCKPCQKTSQKKYRESNENCEKTKSYQRRYRMSEEGREKRRNYERSEKCKAMRAANVYIKKPCKKCGTSDRYKTGICKACQNTRKRRLVELAIPCGICGETERHKGGNCKACQKTRERKYAQSNAYHETRRKQSYRLRRLQFEFSLQTQQKAVEQCQTKST